MINVLSLYDGISAGRLALHRAGVSVNNYFKAEIDKFPSQVSHAHFPQDINFGDVTKWKEWDIDWASIDLVFAGFPCQSWSLAGKQLGDRDERGQLFWTTLDIIKHIRSVNPNVHFLLENVKMKKDFEDYITSHTEAALGFVNKILINSATVSAQNRNRFYWTSWVTTQPEIIDIFVKDILEENPDPRFELSQEAIDYMSRLRNGKPRWEYHKNPLDGKASCLTANMYKGVPYGVLQIYCGASRGRYLVDGVRQDSKMLTAGLTSQRIETRKDGKTNCLTTVQKDNLAIFDFPEDGKMFYRRLTPIECARLQTFPDDWCSMVSNSQAYKAYGNSWTVDVVAHLIRNLYN